MTAQYREARGLLLGGALVVLAMGCGSDGSGPAGPATEFESDDSPSTDESFEGDEVSVPGDTRRAPSTSRSEPSSAYAPQGDAGAMQPERQELHPGEDPGQGREESLLPMAPGDNPFAVEPVCSSGTFWMSGASERMHPGKACISCHSRFADRAPIFHVAGTVFPTAHEPDDCNALGLQSIKIEITGADGRRFELAVNEVGNFFGSEEVALPYSARVISAEGVRAMASRQHSGDCNGCHTQVGMKGAPGRIIPP